MFAVVVKYHDLVFFSRVVLFRTRILSWARVFSDGSSICGSAEFLRLNNAEVISIVPKLDGASSSVFAVGTIIVSSVVAQQSTPDHHLRNKPHPRGLHCYERTRGMPNVEQRCRLRKPDNKTTV